MVTIVKQATNLAFLPKKIKNKKQLLVLLALVISYLFIIFFEDSIYTKFFGYIYIWL